jgi:TRAP transporter TAXI family solute receptor
MLSKCRAYILLLSLVCTLGVVLVPVSAQSFDLLLGTEAPGTFSYFSGRVLCRLINQQVDGVTCRQVATENGVYNLTNLHDGSLDISLVDSRTLFDAATKMGPFKYLDIGYENLRALAPLYDIPVALVVRRDAGISSLDDLKGKRINAGTPQSQQYLAVETIMKAKNWTKDDFSLFGDLPPSGAQDDIKAFCYGTMQAMVFLTIHPDFSLRHLLKSCDADLLNIDDGDIKKLVDRDPALWKTEIPAGLYPTHSGAVTTFGRREILVVSADLDDDTVTEILAVLLKNRQQLIDAHVALSRFSRDSLREGFSGGMALHPAVEKYLAEHP